MAVVKSRCHDISFINLTDLVDGRPGLYESLVSLKKDELLDPRGGLGGHGAGARGQGHAGGPHHPQVLDGKSDVTPLRRMLLRSVAHEPLTCDSKGGSGEGAVHNSAARRTLALSALVFV